MSATTFLKRDAFALQKDQSNTSPRFIRFIENGIERTDIIWMGISEFTDLDGTRKAFVRIRGLIESQFTISTASGSTIKLPGCLDSSVWVGRIIDGDFHVDHLVFGHTFGKDLNPNSQWKGVAVGAEDPTALGSIDGVNPNFWGDGIGQLVTMTALAQENEHLGPDGIEAHLVYHDESMAPGDYRTILSPKDVDNSGIAHKCTMVKEGETMLVKQGGKQMRYLIFEYTDRFKKSNEDTASFLGIARINETGNVAELRPFAVPSHYFQSEGDNYMAPKRRSGAFFYDAADQISTVAPMKRIPGTHNAIMVINCRRQRPDLKNLDVKREGNSRPISNPPSEWFPTLVFVELPTNEYEWPQITGILDEPLFSADPHSVGLGPDDQLIAFGSQSKIQSIPGGTEINLSLHVNDQFILESTARLNIELSCTSISESAA